MRRDLPDLVPPLQAFLDAGKDLPQQPDIVRARAMARTEAALTAASAVEPAAGRPRRRPAVMFAVAACVACAFAVGVTAAALRLVVRRPHATESPPAAAPAPKAAPSAPSEVGPELAPSVTAQAAQPRPRAAIAAPTRSLHRAAEESYAAEVELLQRAQEALLGRDYPGALTALREHGRRFQNGRLAEQREALRVRSLADSGRVEEARRAAAEFAGRFPRSVLLPRLAGDAGRLDVEVAP